MNNLFIFLDTLEKKTVSMKGSRIDKVAVQGTLGTLLNYAGARAIKKKKKDYQMQIIKTMQKIIEKFVINGG